jgi:recombination associated protein RdgC
MQLLEKVRKTEFLGREFLAWLWFRTETERGHFKLGDKSIEIWFDGKITLQGENERGLETITCSGESQNMKEARFALAENKEVVQATLILSMDDNQWTFVLDSLWLNFKTFKTPKVIQDKRDDPDGLFYEKMFLIEAAVSAVDDIYAEFIKLRISPEWSGEELPALSRWVQEGKS